MNPLLMCMAFDCFENSVENPFPVAKKMVKDKGFWTSLTKYAINCEFRMTSLIRPCYLFTLDNYNYNCRLQYY